MSASHIICIYSNRIQDMEVRASLFFVFDVLFTNFLSKIVILLTQCHQLNDIAHDLFIKRYRIFKRQYMLYVKSAESIQIPVFDWSHVLFVCTCFSSPSVPPTLPHAFSETLKPSLSSQIVPSVSPGSSRDTRGRIVHATV